MRRDVCASCDRWIAIVILVLKLHVFPTGRKKLIFAGISLEVCAAFPAMTAGNPRGRRSGVTREA